MNWKLWFNNGISCVFFMGNGGIYWRDMCHLRLRYWRDHLEKNHMEKNPSFLIGQKRSIIEENEPWL